jgi:hypothetical protein
MPEPLQTFRAVEGASPAYTAAVSLASQPFVLHHQQVYTSTASTTAAITGASMTFETLASTRFFPWTLRTASSCYPVRVPNAYNRVYIYPLWITSTDDTTAGNMPFFVVGTYVAPYIMPYGLFPETRGHTTFSKLNPKCYRFPDDVVTAANPSDTVSSPTRTNGLWSVLPPYGTNATTSNGVLTGTTGGTNTFGRAPGLVGAAYMLPDDLSISSGDGATALGPTTPALSNSFQIMGMGQEYQTLGTEEIVVALGSNPTGLTISNAASVVGKSYRAHFFLMGVFLG